MTTEQEKRINQLLDKYLAGNCTAAEKQIIDEWYHTLSPGDSNYLQQDTAFAANAAKQLRHQLKGLPASAPVRPLLIRRIYTIAAAAAVLTGILLTALYLLETNKPATAPILTAMHTGRKELKKLTLPDGSIVWMNEFSQLEWNSRFNDTDRVVKLTGEARFAIAPQSGRPFRVQVGNTTTTVLGTEFNVEGYGNEQSIKVALLSGKVRFEEGGQRHLPVVLTPGKMITYSRLADSSQLSAIGNASVDAWIEGAMVFNEVPVAEAIARLARHFDWTIQWKRRLPGDGTTVTALFRRETPEQMLQGIALTNQVRYTLKDKQLTIYGTD